MNTSADYAAGIDRQAHWEAVYRQRGERRVSWYEPVAQMSLSLVESLELPFSAPIIDVGGGVSTLADGLVARGFTDVTVLDISQASLDIGRSRQPAGPVIHWINRDLLEWQPERQYTLWHDRAVLHFFTDEADREQYLARLDGALGPDGVAILATFAPDGPPSCSGLAVSRYSRDDLASLLSGAHLTVVADRRHEHVTPAGAVQPFTWVVARRS